jgi:hypothetical protein
MSLVGLVNLAERLLNQNSTQSQEAQVPQKTTAVQTNPATQGVAEDQFTRSPQNGQAQNSAQDAGLFSVTRVSFFSTAAEFLLGQSTAAAANQPAPANFPATANTPSPQNANANAALVPARPTPAATTAALAALPQAATTATNRTNLANTAVTQQPVAPITNFTPAATALAAASTATSNLAVTQRQLQALNQALAALGLSSQDIQQLDRIASIINDFNPSAFTALAYQLEVLAQQVAPQAAATSANAPLANANAAANGTAPANTAPVNTPAAAGTAANGGAFQIQELVIKFSGVNLQETEQTGGSANNAAQGAQANGNGNGGANASQYAAFNLQIEEVNLTLVNGNGQTAQIQAPLPNATTNGAVTIPAAVPQSAKTANT